MYLHVQGGIYNEGQLCAEGGSVKEDGLLSVSVCIYCQCEHSLQNSAHAVIIYCMFRPFLTIIVQILQEKNAEVEAPLHSPLHLIYWL